MGAFGSGHRTAPQQGTITITAGNTSGTDTISAVGTNAYVIYNGFTCNRSSAGLIGGNDMPGLDLTNTTTVTATIDSSGADDIIVYYTVIDPY